MSVIMLVLFRKFTTAASELAVSGWIEYSVAGRCQYAVEGRAHYTVPQEDRR